MEQRCIEEGDRLSLVCGKHCTIKKSKFPKRQVEVIQLKFELFCRPYYANQGNFPPELQLELIYLVYIALLKCRLRIMTKDFLTFHNFLGKLLEIRKFTAKISLLIFSIHEPKKDMIKIQAIRSS